MDACKNAQVACYDFIKKSCNSVFQDLYCLVFCQFLSPETICVLLIPDLVHGFGFLALILNDS